LFQAMPEGLSPKAKISYLCSPSKLTLAPFLTIV